MQGVEVVLAEQGQIRLGQRGSLDPGEDEDGVGPGDLRLALRCWQPWIERVGDGAEFHERVQVDRVVKAGRELEHDRRLTPDPLRGEAARGRDRLTLELRVRQLVAVRDQRNPVGACLGALGEPVVQ